MTHTPPAKPTRPRPDEDPVAVLETLNAQYAWGRVVSSLAVGLVVGMVVAWQLIPTYLMSMVQSIQGDTPKVYWYVSRSAGVIAYVLLWLSMAWGLLLTTTIGKQIGKVAPIVDLHRHFSWLSLAFTLAHVIVLIGDRYANFSLAVLFIPLIGDGPAYQPYAMALGQIATYLIAVVSMSFWVRTWTGQSAWRIIHYASFIAFIGASTHAWLHVDAMNTLFWLYAISSVSVLFLSVLRVLTAVSPVQVARD